MKPPLKPALEPFGVTIFTEINRLAARHRAVSLSQGFPDFDGPEEIIEAAHRAMRDGHNQYAPSHGVPELRQAIAEQFGRRFGREPDPDAEVTVFSGATEALFSAIMALSGPGDEVVLLEPYYDSYPACVAMAGATPRYVPLTEPDFALDGDALAAALGPRTKLIVINTPMNPCGRVFSREELQLVAELAERHDAYVLSDEVYEHLVYDGLEHLPIACLDGMWPRTLSISSTGKTFSLTGWKLGWAVGPPELQDAIRRAHQFVTFCSATPLQHAMAAALRQGDGYYRQLRRDYAERRGILIGHLERAGFEVRPPQGSYFVLADISGLGFDDDFEFCRHLIETGPIATIPVSAFYHQRRGGRSLVRFAFCKRVEQLRLAGERLEQWAAHR